MVTRNEQAAASRAKLVSVARRLFVQNGYNSTSVASILNEAGMARGALYHHFPDGKLGVFVAVTEEVDEQFHHGLDAVLDTDLAAVEQILAGFETLMRLAADRDFARIILIEASKVLPGAWADGSEFLLLRDALERAMAAGELKTAPLDAAAASLYGAARRSADFVARSPDPQKAAKESFAVLVAIMDGLRP